MSCAPSAPPLPQLPSQNSVAPLPHEGGKTTLERDEARALIKSLARELGRQAAKACPIRG